MEKRQLNNCLDRIHANPKTGDEGFHQRGNANGITVLDFWRWSTSDLLSNAARGVLAEFIVAKALGIVTDDRVRDEWAPYDLETADGIKVEVKSAAYIQSWRQEKESLITFRVPKTGTWDAETNIFDPELRRQADVYVFALLAERTLIPDPLNLDHWHFYVLPTSVLDARTRSQHSITLKSLEALSGGIVSFDGLGEEVIASAKQVS